MPLMTTNVENLLYGYLEGCDAAVRKDLLQIEFGEEETPRFRFCGREVQQFDGFSIKVTVADDTKKIKSVSYNISRKLNAKCTDGEVGQMRPAVQAMAWIARRPDITCRVSQLETLINHATVKDSCQTNRVLEYAKGHSTAAFSCPRIAQYGKAL